MTRPARVVLWACDLCDRRGATTLAEARVAASRHARQEHPDTSGFTDPEIVYRLKMRNHIGFVVAANTPERVEQLLTQYIERIARDFGAVLPGADKVST